MNAFFLPSQTAPTDARHSGCTTSTATVTPVAQPVQTAVVSSTVLVSCELFFFKKSSITDWRGAESSSCWTSVGISTKNGHRKHCCQYSGRGTYKLCCHQQKNEWTRHSSFSHRATGGPHRWKLFYFFPFQITWVTEVTYCYCFGIRHASCVNIIFSRTTGPILINFGM